MTKKQLKQFLNYMLTCNVITINEYNTFYFKMLPFTKKDPY